MCKSLQTQPKGDTIQQEITEQVMVSRAELVQEHSHLVARLHLIRKWLGYPPLQTGKEQRRSRHE